MYKSFHSKYWEPKSYKLSVPGTKCTLAVNPGLAEDPVKCDIKANAVSPAAAPKLSI